MKIPSKNISVYFVVLTFCWFIFFGIAPARALTMKLLRRPRLGIPVFSPDAKITPEFLSKLRKHVQSDDLVFLRGRRSIKLYAQSKIGGKAVVIRQSLEDLKKDIKIMKEEGVRLDYICYNPEMFDSSNTPGEEKHDPVRAASMARALADEHNAGLIIVPDSVETLPKYGTKMAEYADIFAIQMQRWQLLPEEKFLLKAKEFIEIVKKGNPDVPVIIQISTAPPTGKKKADGKKEYTPVTVDELLSSTRSIEKIAYGAGFLLSDEGAGFERFLEFLSKID